MKDRIESDGGIIAKGPDAGHRVYFVYAIEGGSEYVLWDSPSHGRFPQPWARHRGSRFDRRGMGPAGLRPDNRQENWGLCVIVQCTGKALAGHRKAAGLTQVALARRANAGRHVMQFWEAKSIVKVRDARRAEGGDGYFR